MKFSQFTTVKVGGMDVGMLTSVPGNVGPALIFVLIFVPELMLPVWVVTKLVAKAQTH